MTLVISMLRGYNITIMTICHFKPQLHRKTQRVPHTSPFELMRTTNADYLGVSSKIDADAR
jgi:hypothetical protein